MKWATERVGADNLAGVSMPVLSNPKHESDVENLKSIKIYQDVSRR